MEIAYVGEHTGLGNLGKFFIVLCFSAALLSAIAYLFLTFSKKSESSWRIIARTGFGLHGVAIIGIFGLMYYLIYNHYFEFYYVWFHSSKILPPRYIFACFWEGQEGSFLFWTLWQMVLGFFIVRKGGEWESPVMCIIMLVQVFLCSMVLGTWIGNLHIGNNPFILLRENPEMQNLPWVKLPDYLSRIADGRGLNPLLQNYWMVIHPPTLFLGFASTVVPFAFAMAGLITGKVNEWLRPAIPYTFFGVMILGTGILMGAAWAYEALSFGGFWAWDPVENASLVPWLTFVGAAHLMIISKRDGHALMSTFILTILTFILILYSTFLTRSGILGDSSIHAFTDLGMLGQLVVYMVFFIVIAIGLLIIHRKKIPLSKEEESITSREFWMFIGMLVILISAIQIISTTSIPVINKLFSLKLAPPVDLIDHYNKWQVPIASIVCLLMAVGQYFKYKNTDMKYFNKKIILSLLVAIVITTIYQLYIQLPRPQHVFLLFAALFSFFANIDFMIRTLKGNIKHSGASIAHAGIALIMIGALVSNVKKTIISQNRLNVNMGKDLPSNENIMIRKGDTLQMADYFVTYKGKEKEGVNIHYEVEYFKLNKQTGKLDKQFSLKPIIQLNERMGNAPEPDTKRFFDKDLYTHITYAEIEKDAEEGIDDYQPPKTEMVQVGDTFATSNSLIVLEKLNAKIDSTTTTKNIKVEAVLTAIDMNKKIYGALPSYNIENNIAYSGDAQIDPLGLKFAFTKIDTETGKIELQIFEKKSNYKEFVVMKAIIFPHINILWTGCLLMIIGTFTAVRKRIGENKRLNESK